MNQVINVECDDEYSVICYQRADKVERASETVSLSHWGENVEDDGEKRQKFAADSLCSGSVAAIDLLQCECDAGPAWHRFFDFLSPSLMMLKVHSPPWRLHVEPIIPSSERLRSSAHSVKTLVFCCEELQSIIFTASLFLTHCLSLLTTVFQVFSLVWQDPNVSDPYQLKQDPTDAAQHSQHTRVKMGKVTCHAVSCSDHFLSSFWF